MMLALMNITCSCRYRGLLMNIQCYRKYLTLSLFLNFAFGIMLLNLSLWTSLSPAYFGSLIQNTMCLKDLSSLWGWSEPLQSDRKIPLLLCGLFIWPGLSSRSNEWLAAPVPVPKSIMFSLWLSSCWPFSLHRRRGFQVNNIFIVYNIASASYACKVNFNYAIAS